MAKSYYIDFENSRFLNASGNVIEPNIDIYRGSEYSFNTILLENYDSTSRINLSSNSDFGCYIGRYYGVSASPVVSSTSFDSSLSSLSAGVLNFTFDTSISALGTDMSGLYSQYYEIEIWSHSGVNGVLIAQSPITITNIAVDPPSI